MVEKIKEKLLQLLGFSNPVVLAAVMCAIALYSGIVSVRSNRDFKCLIPKSQIVEISGKVISNPVKSLQKDTYSFDFEPNYCLSKKNVKSSCKGVIRVILPSAIVEAFFPGKLYSAAKPISDGGVLCETGCNLVLSGKFLSSNNVFLAKSAKSSEWDNTFWGKLSHFRALCRLQFRRLMFFWGEAGGLLLALVSGMREYTDKSLSEAFRNAGLSHILALSGMHLSLFTSISRKLSTKVVGKRNSFIFQFAAVCVFIWFAGLSPSLFRAFLCSTIFLIAAAVNFKRIKMLSVLALAFLIHIVIFPHDMFSAAFKLSYGALVGILLFGQFFTRLSAHIFPIGFSQALGASIGAQGFTIPITINIFKMITPIGIISSVIVSPLITFFIYAGLFLIILSLIFPFCAPLSAFFMKILYIIIEKLVLFFGAVPAIKF